MKSPLAAPRYTLGEEIANSLTHGLGLVLSIAGLAVLAAFASALGTICHFCAILFFVIPLAA